MFDRFDEGAQRVVVVAEHACRELRAGVITTPHLLLGAFAAEDDLAGVIAAAGADAERLYGLLAERTEWAMTPYRPTWSEPAKEALLEALRVSLRWKSPTIRPAHLLLGAIAVDDGAVALLAEMAVDVPALTAAAEAVAGPVAG